jgi:dipeptide/tripeptide permease
VAGYTAAQVEEVRMVMRMLPIFFTTILFWTIYCQVSTPTSTTLYPVLLVWGALLLGTHKKLL